MTDVAPEKSFSESNGKTPTKNKQRINVARQFEVFYLVFRRLKAARKGTSTKAAAEFLTFRFNFSCWHNSCVSFLFFMNNKNNNNKFFI